MDQYILRPCDYIEDRQRLIDLLLAHRAATDLRLYPTVWRMLLLLTSRVWAPEKDTCLWESPEGKLAGFAMLWRRRLTSPYLVLEWFIHPSQVSYGLVSSIAAWGSQRAQELAVETSTMLALYTTGLDPSNMLGFSLLPPNPEGHDVYYARSLDDPLPQPTLPSGYIMRRLRGEDDLAAYQSLYGFAAVNQHHQQEQLASDEYCCLVIANPAGEYVAYCECSIWRAEWDLTGQHIGWIDYVETKESEQGKGLGRAVLLAGLARLQSWGAGTAMLVTISNNTSAVRLYEKIGFTLVDVKLPLVFEKSINCEPAVTDQQLNLPGATSTK